MDRTSSLVGHDRADSMDGLTFESIGLTGWIAWWVALWVTPPPLCEIVFIYCR
jgi:hypothetical protein